jgi:hypothetical protein
MQIQPDKVSASFLNMQSLLQLILIRKEAKSALARLSIEKSSPLKQRTSERDQTKSSVRVGGRSFHSNVSQLKAEDSTVAVVHSRGSPDFETKPSQMPQSPYSVRSRPAYASTNMPSPTKSTNK